VHPSFRTGDSSPIPASYVTHPTAPPAVVPLGYDALVQRRNHLAPPSARLSHGPHPRAAGRALPVAIALAAALVLTAGCHEREPSSGQPGATGAQAHERPVITLLDPGAEPRRPLRYRLTEGAREALVMRTNLTIDSTTDGVPTATVEYPPMVMHLGLHIASKPSDSQARYTFALESVEVEDAPGVRPEILESMRQHFRTVTGMTGSAHVDARGFNWDARMDRPRDMSPATQQMMDSASQSMDQVSAPLPEEPVGQGARWELRQTIEQNGVTLQQTTLFELIEVDGTRGILTTRITQHADRQPMTTSGAPGATEMLSLDSSGSGRIYFDLDRLVPRSTLDMRSDYTLRITSGDTPQTVATHVDMRIEVAAQ
jgi:hypothetical protein